MYGFIPYYDGRVQEEVDSWEKKQLLDDIFRMDDQGLHDLSARLESLAASDPLFEKSPGCQFHLKAIQARLSALDYLDSFEQPPFQRHFVEELGMTLETAQEQQWVDEVNAMDRHQLGALTAQFRTRIQRDPSFAGSRQFCLQAQATIARCRRWEHQWLGGWTNKDLALAAAVTPVAWLAGWLGTNAVLGALFGDRPKLA